MKGQNDSSLIPLPYVVYPIQHCLIHLLLQYSSQVDQLSHSLPQLTINLDAMLLTVMWQPNDEQLIFLFIIIGHNTMIDD